MCAHKALRTLRDKVDLEHLCGYVTMLNPNSRHRRRLSECSDGRGQRGRWGGGWTASAKGGSAAHLIGFPAIIVSHSTQGYVRPTGAELRRGDIVRRLSCDKRQSAMLNSSAEADVL